MKLGLIGLSKGDTTPNLGLAYIAAYLRKNVKMDIFISDNEDTLKRLRSEKPDLVAISSVSHEFGNAKKLASEIKEEFGVPVILGGHHISSIPGSLPGCVDVGVIGEGEETMLELIKLYKSRGSFPASGLKKIDGLVYHNRGGVAMTKPRKLIEPLDNIPFPARDLVPMEEYFLKPSMYVTGRVGRWTSMITSRGCPYRCVFCSSSHFWKRIRFHSSGYVLKEIKLLVDKYNVQAIRLYDDLFTADKERLRKIVKGIKDAGIDKKVEFTCNCRANLMDEETCRLLKEMNVVFIFFGFESGSEKVLKFLKKGTVTVADNRRAADLCKKFDIKIGSGFMIGNPGETREDLMKTYEFIREVPLDFVGVSITTPIPGTELWEIAKKDGIVTDDMDWEKLGTRPTKNLEENIYMNKEIERRDFVKIYGQFRKLADRKNMVYSKINFRKLLSPREMKRVIREDKIRKYLISKITNML